MLKIRIYSAYRQLQYGLLLIGYSKENLKIHMGVPFLPSLALPFFPSPCLSFPLPFPALPISPSLRSEAP